MNKRLGLATILVTLCFGCLGVVHAQVKGYIIDRNRKKHEGYLSARSDGSILFQKSKSNPTKRTFNRGSIRRIGTPKPGDVSDLEKAFKRNKHDDVIKKADAAVKKYGWLGWGGLIYYLKGRAQLAKNDTGGAESSFRAGMKYSGAEGRTGMLKRAILEVRISKGDVAAMKDVQRLEPCTFKYKALGVATEARGRKLKDKNLLSEAALQYLKVILVYSKEDLADDPGSQADRKDSYRLLIGVLKELKDNRAKDFEGLMKQEYGR